MKLTTLPIYDTQMKILQDIPDEQFARIVKAMFAYSQDQELPELEGLEKSVFEFVKISIDSTKAKAEGGAKGGNKTQARARDEQRNPVAPWQDNASKSEEHAEDNESTGEGTAKHGQSMGEGTAKQLNNEELNNEKLNNEKSTKTRAIARESDFNDLWNLYPRKQGRKEAFEAFKRAIRDGDTVDEMRKGIRNYSAFIIQNKTEPRYVKQGSTYFRQRAWKDKYDLPNFDYDMRDDDMSGVLMEL